MFKFFKNLLNREPQPPKVTCSISGMKASFEKKAGVLFTAVNEDTPDMPGKPASEDNYYEVTVESSGENPDYPANLSKHFFTAACQSTGFVFQNGAHCLSAGTTITAFTVEEEFDDGEFKPNVIFMGKKMPPHHTATLRVQYKDAQGKKSEMLVGFSVRKSERESRAWEMAARCPVTYI